MDEVADLLKTWELPDLIPKFQEQGITIQALSALHEEDLKDLIPQTGPRVLFMRCWKTWKEEFSSISLSNLDLLEFTNDESQIILLQDGQEEPENKIIQTIPECGILESILRKSLEASSLLIYKGGTLDGDATRNLLSSIIASEILKEHTNSPITGGIYFKWANFIKELFPGERTTTYYIPACTTATGSSLQARGKLVHQVLNKRRRLQQLGALTTKRKRSKDDSRAATPPPRRTPVNTPSEVEAEEECEDLEENIKWLRNSSEPWSLVESKWTQTYQHRMALLHSNNDLTLEKYLNEFPALKKPHGYALLHTDFERAYGEKKENLFQYFPTAKIKILELLNKKKIKDVFSKEISSLADSSKEDNKNVAAFLAIPQLMSTSTVQHKNNSKKTKIWKLSKAEAREAFIKHLKSDAEIGQYMQQRLKTLKEKGATSQPYIIIVGESLKSIKTYLVVVNNSVIYNRNSILQAVDTCYKAIWALNAEYGIDSHAVWYFIQRGLYKMTSKFVRSSTAAESLLTDCNL